MQKGALIIKSFKTLSGNNPFHVAALNAHLECMNIILNANPTVLDSVNKDLVIFICFC